MNKLEKATRPKPRLPKGFRDAATDEIGSVTRMLGTIERVFRLHGFDPIETPAIEYTEVLGKFLPDQDRPGEGVFSFQDDDEQWLSLRYDLTAPLARYVAENFDQLPKPFRSYRAGYVFRNEKPGPGRFRQFMQFDADTVGSANVAADAEMCMLMADTLEALGIERGDYLIRVNNRKILDGVLETIGVANERQRLTVLRSIDKLDRIGIDGVRQLLGCGRKDESGDFTRGAELNESQTEVVLKALQRRLVDDESAPLGTPFSGAEVSNRQADPPGFNEGFRELADIIQLCRGAGYQEDRISADPSVVRGLEYYTGPVYEAELLFETVNEHGEQARFGSVGGGGRYDGLVARFRGGEVPATGFSIGVSRLHAALKALGKLDSEREHAPVVVLVLDQECRASYDTMAAELRAAGIRAETYVGTSGMKAQMKYADRRGSPCVVIEGSDERAAGEVQIKNLVEGARLSAGITGRDQWTEARPAQVSVPRAQLVAAVRAVLDGRER